MTPQEILSTQNTKTWKIQQLLSLGLTRRQIADLMNVGYGFVQNVYAAQRGASTTPTFSFIPFNRRFGIEFEAYNVTKSKLLSALRVEGIEAYDESYNHANRAYWKIVSDSSIEGRNAFEVVSPVLQGLAGLEQVEKVCKALKACNAYINKSCGTHIHFDATEFGLNQWKNILLNYAHYEDIIDSFMPASRRANANYYCKSLKGYERKIKEATTLSKMVDAFSSRYFKINLQAFSRHNTIEFRQHSGTIEFEKISNWITFLHNLVEFSKFEQANTVGFEGLNKFQTAETLAYLHNRIQDLAA